MLGGCTRQRTPVTNKQGHSQEAAQLGTDFPVSAVHCQLPGDPYRNHHISIKQLKIDRMSAERQQAAAGKSDSKMLGKAQAADQPPSRSPA